MVEMKRMGGMLITKKLVTAWKCDKVVSSSVRVTEMGKSATGTEF